MKNRTLILKKESFGGFFVDTAIGWGQFLRPEEYETKKRELLQLQEQGQQIKFIDVTLQGYPLLEGAISTPNSIFWEITKRCNGTCTGCFMDSNASKWDSAETTLEEIAGIVRQFVDLGGYSVRLTGGEATRRPDFLDIVDCMNEAGIQIGLNTNGMFGENMLENILSRNIKDIRISLDGPEEVNDHIRWQGNYRGTLKTIKRIADYNQASSNPTKPTLNVVLTRSTVPYMEHMASLAQDYGFKISFGLLRLSGRAKTKEMLSPEEIVHAAYRVKTIRDSLGLAKGAIRINYDIFCDQAQDGKGRKIIGYHPPPFDNATCPLGSSGFTIDAFARIVPCGYLVNAEEWVGEDIRGKDLLDRWYNSPVLNKARRVTRQDCTDCAYHIQKCNGGCPAMAFFVNGDAHGRDPYCIRDVDLTNVGKAK